MTSDEFKLAAVDRRDLLARISIFSSLSDADLDRLVDLTTVKKLRAKQTLLHKGDDAIALYGVPYRFLYERLDRKDTAVRHLKAYKNLRN